MRAGQEKQLCAVEPLPDPSVVPTLSVKEAGRILGIGRSAAYRAVRSGEIPSLWFGHRCRIPTAALAKLLGHSPSKSQPGSHAVTEHKPNSKGPGSNRSVKRQDHECITEVSDKPQKSLRQHKTGGAL